MGKYMKKAKPSASAADTSSPLVGVRTRAKTLALRPPSVFLQLRSRRLEKSLPIYQPRANPNANPKVNAIPTNSKLEEEKDETEGCFGENTLDSDGKSFERNSRETTPCSFIRDTETIGTPGSSTKPNNSTSTSRRVDSSVRRNIPSSKEMEEFFSGPEKIQQKACIENYNFDPVNDCPLPGRYEWVKIGAD